MVRPSHHPCREHPALPVSAASVVGASISSTSGSRCASPCKTPTEQSATRRNVRAARREQGRRAPVPPSPHRLRHSVLKCPPHAVAPSRPRAAPRSRWFLHVSAGDAVAHLRACRVLSVPVSPLRIAAPANRYALLALDDTVSCETRMRHSLRCHRVALACPRVVRPCTRPTMRRATRSPAECSSRTLRGRRVQGARVRLSQCRWVQRGRRRRSALS